MDELFYNIKSNEKEKILSYLEANTLRYKKNTTILSNQKKDNIIGIVVSGYVQIIKTNYNGTDNIIEELEEGAIFGTIMSSLSNNDYNLVTKEDSTIILIYFDSIIKNSLNYKYYNQFLKNLLGIMFNKISNNNNRIEILTNKTIRNKLLAYFRIISKKNKSKIIYLPYNYTDLADYLAIDRSAMYRELKNLKDEGSIEINMKKIKLKFYEDI